MTDGQPDEIPIFPLAQVVLFPRVRVPLFIFETRYSEMVRDALNGDCRIGMVTVRPESVADMAGTPSVFEVGCEGTIAESTPHPDGTFHIVLQGTRRFRILEESPTSAERLYRVARIQPLDDPFPESDRSRVETRRVEVLSMFTRLLENSASQPGEHAPEEVFDEVDHVTVTNALSQSLAFSPLEKQGLLEADGIAARLDRLAELLRFRIRELAASVPTSDGVVH